MHVLPLSLSLPHDWSYPAPSTPSLSINRESMLPEPEFVNFLGAQESIPGYLEVYKLGLSAGSFEQSWGGEG